MTTRRSLALVFAAGCGSTYADPTVAQPQPPGPRIAIAIANDKVRAPFDVQLIRENGETSPTYQLKDRYYVQGNAGERYTIRVTNPTDRRVEAVVAVDGLDVVDGDEGDVRKRGYIVPPHGDVRIEGFRTSMQDVATFRFSSVDGSYAGKKGKTRNVGVIAVAIFEEEAAAEQQIVVDGRDLPAPAKNGRYDYEKDLDTAAPHATRGYAPTASKDKAGPSRHERSADKKVAEASRMDRPAPATAPAGGAGATGGAVARRPPPPPHDPNYSNYDGEDEYVPPPEQPTQQQTGRLGLGTEFGEARNSGATYTRFVRAAGKPVAIAELRYNDAAGLTALGIHAQPLPDSGEIMVRETADPFPGDPHFSHAP